jgi:hypothetical protein
MMERPTAVEAVGCLLLAACAGRLGPVNWLRLRDHDGDVQPNFGLRYWWSRLDLAGGG